MSRTFKDGCKWKKKSKFESLSTKEILQPRSHSSKFLFMCTNKHHLKWTERQRAPLCKYNRLLMENKNNTLQCFYLFLKRKCMSSCFLWRQWGVKERRKWYNHQNDVDIKSSHQHLWCKWECHFTLLWPLNGNKMRFGRKRAAVRNDASQSDCRGPRREEPPPQLPTTNHCVSCSFRTIPLSILTGLAVLKHKVKTSRT